MIDSPGERRGGGHASRHVDRKVEGHDGGGEATASLTESHGSDDGGTGPAEGGDPAPSVGGQATTVPVATPTTPATTEGRGGDGPSLTMTATEAVPTTPTISSGSSHDGDGSNGGSGGGSNGGGDGGGGDMHDSGLGGSSPHD